MGDRPIKPGEKRVYGARARKDKHDPWTRVKTNKNTKGQWGTRAQAQAELDKLIDRGWAGHTFSMIVKKVPDQPKVDTWLKGDVVDIMSVPKEFRDDYRDTLYRTARAAAKSKTVVQVNDSFRTRREQEQRWQTYQNGGALAARPGTSDHEFGLSLDINNGSSMHAFDKAMHDEGMMRDVASEGWHYTNVTRKAARGR